MASDVVVRELEPRIVAYHHEHGSFQRIPAAMEELFRWLGEQGLQAVGPPGAHYFTDPRGTPEEDYDWEVFAELEGPVELEGGGERIGVRRLPSALMATLRHRGPYDAVADTYRKLSAWIDAHDYRMAGPSEEIYLNGPDVPPEELLTEVRIPVARPH